LAKTKPSDKQAIGKKLISILKKQYAGPPPRQDRPVLETILYSICLENASHEEAEAAYQRLHSDFHDLNEVRVSSISELSTAFAGLSDPARRALQVRSALGYIFEKSVVSERREAFEFEMLQKMTLEQAVKQLGKIRELSDFVRAWTLQGVLGSHLVPADQRMTDAAVWLGLLPPGTTVETSAEALKPFVKKADVPVFCSFLRRLAVDGRLAASFNLARNPPPEGGHDPADAPERLEALLKSARASRKKSAARKTPSKSSGASRGRGSARDGKKSGTSTKKRARSASGR
jgi:endonuclease-3